jgi:hypothetical protein
MNSLCSSNTPLGLAGIAANIPLGALPANRALFYDYYYYSNSGSKSLYSIIFPKGIYIPLSNIKVFL